MQQAQNLQDGAGPSQPPPNAENPDSNADGAAIEINSSLMFGLDDLDVDEIDQPAHLDDCVMIFYEEKESSGSQHFTSKPKENNKKKKMEVSKRNFSRYNPKSTKFWPQSPFNNRNNQMLLDHSLWLNVWKG